MTAGRTRSRSNEIRNRVLLYLMDLAIRHLCAVSGMIFVISCLFVASVGYRCEKYGRASFSGMSVRSNWAGLIV